MLQSQPLCTVVKRLQVIHLFLSQLVTNLDTPNIAGQMEMRMRVKQRVKQNLTVLKVPVPNAIVQELTTHC